MAYARIEVRKLSPHVGGEVHGVDLARLLDDTTLQEVRRALHDRGVIFFRDQRITVEQQTTAASSTMPCGTTIRSDGTGTA